MEILAARLRSESSCQSLEPKAQSLPRHSRNEIAGSTRAALSAGT